MSQSSEVTIRSLYEVFGRRDLQAVLAMVDGDIDWHAPENLPHGGDFHGRQAVGRFFEGIGEQHAAAHVWTLRGDTPVRFDEYVNAPLSLPTTRAAAR